MREAIFGTLLVILFGGLTVYGTKARQGGVKPESNTITTPTLKFPKQKMNIEPSEASRKRSQKGCGPVPASLRSPPYNLDEFYQQYCDADGIPILASSEVDPEALRIAKRRINVMTQKLSPKVKQAMIDTHTRIAIVGKDELMTNIPEHSDLNEAFPEKDWNKHAIGLGPTKDRPAASVREKNLLCLKGNRLPESDVFVHEFAHAIHYMGLNNAEPNFQIKLKHAYKEAVIKRGLWKDTYASTNYVEYWAEAVQIWFNLNYAERGVHENYINTKAQLKYYDPVLYDLVAQYMPAKSILICPT